MEEYDFKWIPWSNNQHTVGKKLLVKGTRVELDGKLSNFMCVIQKSRNNTTHQDQWIISDTNHILCEDVYHITHYVII